MDDEHTAGQNDSLTQDVLDDTAHDLSESALQEAVLELQEEGMEGLTSVVTKQKDSAPQLPESITVDSDRKLSQYPITEADATIDGNRASLSQYPLGDVTSGTDHGLLSQHRMDASVPYNKVQDDTVPSIRVSMSQLSQYPENDTEVTNHAQNSTYGTSMMSTGLISDRNSLSDTQLTGRKLSEYPISEADGTISSNRASLSQYPLGDMTNGLDHGSLSQYHMDTTVSEKSQSDTILSVRAPVSQSLQYSGSVVGARSGLGHTQDSAYGTNYGSTGFASDRSATSDIQRTKESSLMQQAVTEKEFKGGTSLIQTPLSETGLVDAEGSTLQHPLNDTGLMGGKASISQYSADETSKNGENTSLSHGFMTEQTVLSDHMSLSQHPFGSSQMTNSHAVYSKGPVSENGVSSGMAVTPYTGNEQNTAGGTLEQNFSRLSLSQHALEPAELVNNTGSQSSLSQYASSQDGSTKGFEKTSDTVINQIETDELALSQHPLGESTRMPTQPSVLSSQDLAGSYHLEAGPADYKPLDRNGRLSGHSSTKGSRESVRSASSHNSYIPPQDREDMLKKMGITVPAPELEDFELSSDVNHDEGLAEQVAQQVDGFTLVSGERDLKSLGSTRSDPELVYRASEKLAASGNSGKSDSPAPTSSALLRISRAPQSGQDIQQSESGSSTQMQYEFTEDTAVAGRQGHVQQSDPQTAASFASRVSAAMAEDPITERLLLGESEQGLRDSGSAEHHAGYQDEELDPDVVKLLRQGGITGEAQVGSPLSVTSTCTNQSQTSEGTTYMDLPNKISMSPDVSMIPEQSGASDPLQTPDKKNISHNTDSTSPGVSSDVEEILKKYENLGKNKDAPQIYKLSQGVSVSDSDASPPPQVKGQADSAYFKPSDARLAERVHSAASKESGKDDADTDDGLSERVRHLLEDKAYQKGDGHWSGDSQLDYSTLAKDLDEIQDHLSALRKQDSSGQDLSSHSSNSFISRRSETDDPHKRYSWDYGADIGYKDGEGFVSSRKDSELDRLEDRTEPEGLSTRTQMKIQPLLTGGVVPVDVALDIVHATEAAIERGDFKNGNLMSGKVVNEKQASDAGSEGRMSRRDLDGSRSGSEKGSTRDVSGMDAAEAEHLDGDTLQSDLTGRPEETELRTISDNSLSKGTLSADYRAHSVSPQAGGYSTVTQDSTLQDDSFKKQLHNRSRSADPSTLTPNGERYQLAETEPAPRGESLSDRVYQILTRSSPHRQAYQYLREAESNEQLVNVDRMQRVPSAGMSQDDSSVYNQQAVSRGAELGQRESYGSFKSVPYDDSYRSVTPRDYFHSTTTGSPQGNSRSPSFRLSVTPIKSAPFSAFNNMEHFLASQLDKMSQARFDKSMEWKTPGRDSAPGQQDQEFKEAWGTPNRFKEKSKYSTSKDSTDVHDQFSSIADRPHSSSLGTAESRDHVSKRTNSEDFLRRDVLQELPSTGTQRDTSRTTIDSSGYKLDSSRSLSQQISQDISTRPKSASPTWRPYMSKDWHIRGLRPAGSHQLYFVESDTNSETTVESTHPGSDDARAPVFPTYVLGTRTEAPAESTGVYSKKQLGTRNSPDVDILSTIQENENSHAEKSFTESSHSRGTEQNAGAKAGYRTTEEWVNGNHSKTPADWSDPETAKHPKEKDLSINAQKHSQVMDRSRSPVLSPSKSKEDSSILTGLGDRTSCDRPLTYGLETRPITVSSLADLDRMRQRDEPTVYSYTTNQYRNLSPNRGPEDYEIERALRKPLEGATLDTLHRPAAHTPQERHLDMPRLPLSNKPGPGYSQEWSRPYSGSPSTRYPLERSTTPTDWRLQGREDKFSPLVPQEDDEYSEEISEKYRTPTTKETRLDPVSGLPTKYTFADGSKRSHSPGQTSGVRERSPGRGTDPSPLSLRQTSSRSPIRGVASTERKLASPVRTTTLNTSSRANTGSAGHTPYRKRIEAQRMMEDTDTSSDNMTPRPRSPPNRSQRKAAAPSPATSLPANINEMWERFQALNMSQSDRERSASSPLRSDVTSLMTNPVQHFIKKYQKELKGRKQEQPQDQKGAESEGASNRSPLSWSISADTEASTKTKERKVDKNTSSNSVTWDIPVDVVEPESDPAVAAGAASCQEMLRDEGRKISDRKPDGLQRDIKDARPAAVDGEAPVKARVTPGFDDSEIDHGSSKVEQSPAQSPAYAQTVQINKPADSQTIRTNTTADSPREETNTPTESQTEQQMKAHASSQTVKTKTPAELQTRQVNTSADSQTSQPQEQSDGSRQKKSERPTSRTSSGSATPTGAASESSRHKDAVTQITPASHRSKKTADPSAASAQQPDQQTVRKMALQEAIKRLIEQETQTSDKEDHSAPPGGQHQHHEETQTSDIEARIRLALEQQKHKNQSTQTHRLGKSKARDSAEAEHQQAGPTKGKRLAFAGQEETLSSIPEDSTLDSLSTDLTTSSLDSDSMYFIAKRRNLPDDPKLIKLQRKIQKQKEKYARDKIREQKRKEKIVMLQQLLKQKGKVSKVAESTSDTTTSTLSSTGRHIETSTPASHRFPPRRKQDSTDSDTLVNSMVSPGTTLRDESSLFTGGRNVNKQDMDDSSICVCKPKRRAISPKQKKTKQNAEIQLKLQEVKYSHYQDDKELKRVKAAKKRTSASPKSRQRPASSKHAAAKESTMSKSSKTIDFGNTFPSPAVAVTKQQVHHDKVMVSEGVQTATLNKNRAHEDRGVVSVPASVSKERLQSNPLGGSTENEVPPSQRKQAWIAPPGGLAWFVPVTESRPWRKPLGERQALSSEPAFQRQTPFYQSQELPPTDQQPPEFHMSKKPPLGGSTWPGTAKSDTKQSLQEAFIQRKQDFISRSRERQRYVLLRSQERQIQELHQRERQELFPDRRKKHANPDAHPLSDNLFVPKRRFMTKQEMKQITQRMYKKLPEVQEKVKNEKRKQEYTSNRLKAQMFKKKVLNKVLNKQGPWLQA